MAVNRPESDLDEGEELLSLTDSKSEEEREDECEDKCEDVLSA